MKTKFFLIVTLVLFTVNIYAQDTKLYIYYPDFEKDETLCGFADTNGNIIIPAGKYADIFTTEFDKIAFVAIKGKKGIYAIDKKEKVLFQVCNYEFFPDKVSNGLFRIIENGKIGFANMDGQIIIKPQFNFIFPFQKNDFAIFCEKGTWIKVHEEYTKFSGGKWGAIDKNGKIIIPPIYEDGKERYLKKDGKWYELKEQGKLELESK